MGSLSSTLLSTWARAEDWAWESWNTMAAPVETQSLNVIQLMIGSRVFIQSSIGGSEMFRQGVGLHMICISLPSL